MSDTRKALNTLYELYSNRLGKDSFELLVTSDNRCLLCKMYEVLDVTKELSILTNRASVNMIDQFRLEDNWNK